MRRLYRAAGRVLLGATLAAVRDRIPTETFAAAWSAGRALTGEQASAAGLAAAASLGRHEVFERTSR